MNSIQRPWWPPERRRITWEARASWRGFSKDRAGKGRRTGKQRFPCAGEAPPGEARFEPCDPATEPCEAEAPVPGAGETPVAEPSSEPAEPGPEAVVEEDPAIEASADEEFTPGDEISEDYPIPLPSDI